MFKEFKKKQTNLGEFRMKLSKEQRKKLKEKLKVMAKMKRIPKLAKEIYADPDKAIDKYAIKFNVSRDVIRELALNKTDKLLKNPIVARAFKVPKSERTDEKIAEARKEYVKKKGWTEGLEETKPFESDKITGKKNGKTKKQRKKD